MLKWGKSPGLNFSRPPFLFEPQIDCGVKLGYFGEKHKRSIDTGLPILPGKMRFSIACLLACFFSQTRVFSLNQSSTS